MTEKEIQDFLQAIQNSHCSADGDELIYDLGELLCWESSQIDYFYYSYSDDSLHYEAKDLLPGGLVELDFMIRSNENFTPI